MKLNTLQSVGVVLSIIWVVGAGLHTRNDDVERAENFVKFAYTTCAHSKMAADDADRSSCEKEKATNKATWMEGSEKNVAFAALAPIPLGWLAGFILLYAWRIQAAGFRAAVPWAEMSRPKKAFAVFCGLAALSAVGLVAVNVMNLYVDTLVPVALAPKAMIIKTGDDLVRAKGTWINTDSSTENALAFPLQTSTIDCDRTVPRCTEARASLSENLMSAELVEYDMQSWTDKTIVLRRDSPCSEEVYTIDLNTDVVTGAGHRINGDTTLCKMFSRTEKWSYRLADGFPVYWDLRMKARPMPLRVFQSFFDH